MTCDALDVTYDTYHDVPYVIILFATTQHLRLFTEQLYMRLLLVGNCTSPGRALCGVGGPKTKSVHETDAKRTLVYG